MIPFFDQLQRDMNRDSHLQLDFNKNSLNTTCSSKYFISQEQIESSKKIRDSQPIEQDLKPFNQSTNLQNTKKQPYLNKKSHSYLKEISKVLKRNKIKCSQKKNQFNFQISKENTLNQAFNISEIHFKTKVSSKNSKTNSQIKKIIENKADNKKSTLNFQEFVQHLTTRTIQSTQKTPNTSRLNLKKKQISKEKKQKKSNFVSKSIIEEKIKQSNNVSQNKINLGQKLNIVQNFDKRDKKIVSKFNIDHNQFHNHNDETFIIHPSSKQKAINSIFLIQNKSKEVSQSKITLTGRARSVKSCSRALSVKQIKNQQTNKKNMQQNIKLQKSLKQAMYNLQIKQWAIEPHGSIKIISQRQDNHKKIEPQQKNQQSKSRSRTNPAQAMRQIHFTKLRQKVMSKMEEYQKIKTFRDSQAKQKKKFKKTRAFSAQQKSIQLTIEGTNMTIGKFQPTKSNFKGKQFKDRRPYTAISRTGLQYDRRQSYRRRSSDRQFRMINLAGINNSANHFRTFSKNAARDVQQLDQCKSDRVIRNLRQKFSRPQTAKTKIPSTSRPSTAKYNIKNPNQSNQPPKNSSGSGIIEYEKITKKQIQKQRMKQKLFGLLIECQQQKQCNKDLMQGLNIFEDYCDNIDKGLKDITEQITQYIQKNE